MDSPKQNSSTGSLQKLWLVIAPRILEVINLTALLTVAGFFVVHSYVATVTGLFTFNISLSQYLAAGINLCIHIFQEYILPILFWGFLGAVIFYLLSRVGKSLTSKLSLLQSLWSGVKSSVATRLGRYVPLLKRIWNIYQAISILIYLLIIVTVTLNYGQNSYSKSPRNIGGGMPSRVILIFKETPKSNSWPFVVDASSNRSEQLELVIELTDGILVRNEKTNATVIIKGDVLQGMEDVPSSNQLTTPSPTITP